MGKFKNSARMAMAMAMGEKLELDVVQGKDTSHHLSPHPLRHCQRTSPVQSTCKSPPIRLSAFMRPLAVSADEGDKYGPSHTLIQTLSS